MKLLLILLTGLLLVGSAYGQEIYSPPAWQLWINGKLYPANKVIPYKEKTALANIPETIVNLYDGYVKLIEKQNKDDFDLMLDLASIFGKVSITYEKNGDVTFEYKMNGYHEVNIFTPQKPTLDGFIKYLRGKK